MTDPFFARLDVSLGVNHISQSDFKYCNMLPSFIITN